MVRCRLCDKPIQLLPILGWVHFDLSAQIDHEPEEARP